MRQCALLLILSMVLLSSCAIQADDRANNMGADGYDEVFNPNGSMRRTVLYYESDDGYITPVMKLIPWEEGIGKAALNYLKDTDENRAAASKMGLKTVIPKETEFELTIDDDGNATVDIINLPALKDKRTEEVLIKTVVNTLTEFDSIKTVSVRFDGEEVGQMEKGTTVNENMTAFELNIADGELQTSTGDINYMTVYLPNNSCGLIYPISYAIPYEPSVMAALEQLILGKVGLYNVFPTGTQIISAEVVNGVLNVNLSGEFNELKLTGNGLDELAYNLIYMTAGALEDISQFNLYVDGRLYDTSAFSVSKPEYINEWR